MSDSLEVNFTVLGETHRAIFPADGWTYAEAKLAKQLTADPDVGQRGMTPPEIAAGFIQGDPDCVMAIIRVTLERAGRKLTAREAAELSSINIEEIVTAAADAISKFADTARAEGDTATRADSDEPSKQENGSVKLAELPSPTEASRSETSGTPDSATT